MPIDPDVQKLIDGLNASILTLTEELTALKKLPHVPPATIQAIQDELKAARKEVAELKSKPNNPPAAPEPEFEEKEVDEGFGFFRDPKKIKVPKVAK